MNILHIIEKFYTNGPARSLLAAVKYAKMLGLAQNHNLIILGESVYPPSLIQARQTGVQIIARQPSPARLHELIEQADIVQVHFWNSPILYDFLRADHPAMRLLLWLKVVGSHAPQSITRPLIDYADKVVATTPATLAAPVWDGYLTDLKSAKQAVVPGIADFDRLHDFQPQPHDGFNVGYIGTVNFSKMYARYVAMSAEIAVPNIKFIVCGGGSEDMLRQQAEALNAAEKFEFRGYVESIQSVLEIMDVFGYPLCEDTYATSEKSLQEAMYAAIPPVVFPYGGVKHLVQHGETGLVVHSELEYQQAIAYLYAHPDERRRLGENAKRYAQAHFAPHVATQQLAQIYQDLLQQPKLNRSWCSSNLTEAEKFIETLGETHAFAVSYVSNAAEEGFSADRIIAQSSPLLAEGEGGITHYRNTYPEDPYLRFWSGLVLQQAGKWSKAIAEFQAAIRLGFPHWRVHWHLVEIGQQTHNQDLLITHLCKVTKVVPDFIPAQQLKSYLDGSDSLNDTK